MPRKIKPPNKAEQAQSAKEYSKELKEYKAQVKAFERSKKLAQRQADKEIKEIIKAAKKTGLYSPKGETLTPYRRRRAREIKASFAEYINPEKHFFLPANKQARKRILERASQLQMQTSRTGIFFPKDTYKTAQLRENKKTGEYGIIRKGKVKKGPNAGKEYTDFTPLPSIDEYDYQKQRLRDMAEELGPLQHGEAFAFEIVEVGHEGYSHRTFNGGDTENAINKLLEYINTYEKHTAAMVHFMRHIRVVKTAPKTWWEMHPPTAPRKRGRIRRSRNQKDTRASKG